MKVNADALLECCTMTACQGAYGIAVIPEDDGWALWSRNDSKVSVAQIKLPAAAFPDGYVKGEESFSVRHTFFPDALIPGTTPDITYGDGKITIVTDKRKQSMRLEGKDAEEYARVMPSYSPEATMAIMSDELITFFKQKQIKDFKGIDGVRLTMTAEGLTAKTENEISSFEDFLPCDSVVVPEEGTYANFNVEMFIPMITCLPKGALVTLGFNTNSPIEINVNTENMEARVILAPIIPEDEE